MVKKGVNLNLSWSKLLVIIIAVIAIIGLAVFAFMFGQRFFGFSSEETSGESEEQSSALLSGEDDDSASSGEDISFWQNLVNKLLKDKIDATNDEEGDIDNENEQDPGEGDVVDEGEVVDEDEILPPEVLCGEDSVVRGFDNSYYSADMTGPICMGHAIDECDTLGKIVAEDFFEGGLSCCEWNCADAPVDECTDTDDGNNIGIKGTCTDGDGPKTDACSTGADFTDFIDENWCEGGFCMGAAISCFAEDAMCYDGMCIPNIRDSDNDGHTDLDEYQEGTNPNDDSDYPGAGGVDCAAECLAKPEGFLHSAVLAEMDMPCLETGISVCSGIGESLFMTEETAECCCIGCMAI